jgi:hypothetical protein
LDHEALRIARETSPRGPRGWLLVAVAACAVVALAGCGASPSASTPASSARPNAGATDGMPPALASMPASSTKSPRSTASPTASGSKSAASPANSAAASSGSGSSQGGGTGIGTAACVTSQAKFNCGPFAYPQDQGVSSGPTVGNNVWNPINGWQQTLYANNPGDWTVRANMPDGNTAIVSYPSSSANYGGRALSSFTRMESSFTEDMHANSATSAWAAYDIWLNNGNNEVMIQHDFANNGPCSGPSATFGGAGGVPQQGWYLCQFGSELVWKLKGDESSGTVDIMAMLGWLENHKYLPSGSTLSSIGYGWEIASTGGRPENFTVSHYTIST